MFQVRQDDRHGMWTEFGKSRHADMLIADITGSAGTDDRVDPGRMHYDPGWKQPWGTDPAREPDAEQYQECKSAEQDHRACPLRSGHHGSARRHGWTVRLMLTWQIPVPYRRIAGCSNRLGQRLDSLQ